MQPVTSGTLYSRSPERRVTVVATCEKSTFKKRQDRKSGARKSGLPGWQFYRRDTESDMQSAETLHHSWKFNVWHVFSPDLLAYPYYALLQPIYYFQVALRRLDLDMHRRRGNFQQAIVLEYSS